MKKKILSMVLIVLLAVSFTGCGGIRSTLFM